MPSPIVKYYLGLAHYLGSTHRDLRAQLFVTNSERTDARDVFARAGLDMDLDRPASKGEPPLIVLNPPRRSGRQVLEGGIPRQLSPTASWTNSARRC